MKLTAYQWNLLDRLAKGVEIVFCFLPDTRHSGSYRLRRFGEAGVLPRVFVPPRTRYVLLRKRVIQWEGHSNNRWRISAAGLKALAHHREARKAGAR